MLPDDHPLRHAELEPSEPSRPTIFDQVEEFGREVLGFPYPKFPKRLNPERKAWFIQAMREELQEFEDAETFEDEVDAIGDMMVFAAGRFPEMGLDGQDHIDCIHGPNMQKVRGALSKRPGSQGFDAVKPEGWVGPDHGPLIRARFPKIILLGYARHGKDTVAEMLRDRYGFQFNSSSMFCAERVLMPYFDAKVTTLGGPYAVQVEVPSEGRSYRRYRSVEECYEDRVNYRDVWFQQIEAYNTPDPSRLCREMFEAGNDIYVGMRSAMEFKAAQKLADLVVWVDASARGLPPEGEDSCTVRPEFADYVIENSGTLEDLANAVDEFVDNIERKPDAQ